MSRRKSRRSRNFGPGVLVWAKYRNWPWWPAVVTERSECKQLLQDPKNLPAGTAKSRVVRFFQTRGGSVAIVDVDCLRYYTRRKSKTADAGEHIDDVRAACAQADAWAAMRRAKRQTRTETREKNAGKKKKSAEQAPQGQLEKVGVAAETANSTEKVQEEQKQEQIQKKQGTAESAFARLAKAVESVGAGLDTFMGRLSQMIALKDELKRVMVEFRRDVAEAE